jgi:23S rRNA (adenine1618-N6)-methyltransferase
MPSPPKKTKPKGSLHPRNPHRGRYDFPALCKACPTLEGFLKSNPAGDQTIDFSDEKAVLSLNQALLAHTYQVKHWTIPEGYLCPPIPGRADYIHYLADLLADSHQGQTPTGKEVRVLDIGTGANCIYPILGSRSYGWKFVASEIDPISVKTARLIVKSNACLGKLVRVVQQKQPSAIFKGILRSEDRYALTMCNPPFHASMEAALAGNQRKVTNLNKGRAAKEPAKLNFGGQNAELWCPGGEVSFVSRMIQESVEFAQQVRWFTCLISKQENLRPLKKRLAHCGAQQVQIIQMSQGQKISRLLAWSFANIGAAQ